MCGHPLTLCQCFQNCPVPERGLPCQCLCGTLHTSSSLSLSLHSSLPPSFSPVLVPAHRHSQPGLTLLSRRQEREVGLISPSGRLRLSAVLPSSPEGPSAMLSLRSFLLQTEMANDTTTPFARIVLGDFSVPVGSKLQASGKFPCNFLPWLSLSV